METDLTAMNITETSKERKAKAPLLAAPPASSTIKPVVEKRRYKRGLAILDVVLRLGGIGAALGAAISMASTQQSLPFFTQFFQFRAQYDDLTAFRLFVIANSITAAYIGVTIPISIVYILRPKLNGPRVIVIFLDTVMAALTATAAGGAASIIYLAHNGNSNANWPSICQQFNDFCQETSAAVVASFLTVVVLMILVILSAFAL